jgi:sulfur carrier protein ThiS
MFMAEDVKGVIGKEANAEINIEVVFIGFPKIYDFFLGDRVRHSFSGKTLSDLLEDLIAHYGEPVRKFLLEKSTQKLDPTIQVMLNGNRVRREDFHRHAIEEGDTLTLLRLLAGG